MPTVVSELESLKNEKQTTAIGLFNVFFFSSLLANHHINLSAASENNQLTVELQDVKKQLEEGKLSLKPIFYPT